MSLPERGDIGSSWSPLELPQWRHFSLEDFRRYKLGRNIRASASLGQGTRSARGISNRLMWLDRGVYSGKLWEIRLVKSGGQKSGY